MNEKLTPAQTIIAKDTHRFKVLCCGRRFGKTTLAVWELAGRAGLHTGYRACYIAPTYQQARDITWLQLKSVCQPIIKEINDSRLEITLKNNSKIFLRGWESIDTLRGQAFDFLVVDEIAMMRRWKENWQEVLRPTLTDKKGHAMFISTPKGYNHFFDLFNVEQDSQKGKDYKSFHFTSFNNEHIPQDEINVAKQELTEDAFAQEYLAEFRKVTGLVHRLWSRDIHFIPSIELPTEWQRARGFDYGSVDPTASLRVAIANDDTWILERCYKQPDTAGSGIEAHATAIRAQDFGYDFMPAFGDPSGKQWAIEFAKHGVHIEPANKEIGQGQKSWLEYCIEKVNQKLKPVPGHTFICGNYIKENAPYLLVMDTPENRAFMQEIELLQWKESGEGVTIPVLDDGLDPHGHFDLLAALRYLVVSYERPKPYTGLLPQFDKERMQMYE